MPTVPVPVPTTPFTATLPAPEAVKPKVLPKTAPRFNRVPLFAANTAPVALSVVSPKVIPAVPEVVLASLAIVSVCAPIDKVPSVCVTPAPSAMRSEVICTEPDTVVGRLKLSPLLSANSRVPPESATLPKPKALALLVARNVPALTVVPPVCRLAPANSSVPAPVLASAPVVAVLAPETVKVFALTSRVPVVPAFNVKPRSVDAVDPVYCKVPPLNTKLAAALLAAPKFPLDPPLPIVATESVPPVSVVTPVCKLVPLSTSVPDPVLLRPPVVAVLAPESVSAFALTSKTPVFPSFNVKFRSDEAVAPVYCRVPPLKTKFAAAFVAWPKLPATPPFPIVATESVPFVSVVTPL